MPAFSSRTLAFWEPTRIYPCVFGAGGFFFGHWGRLIFFDHSGTLDRGRRLLIGRDPSRSDPTSLEAPGAYRGFPIKKPQVLPSPHGASSLTRPSARWLIDVLPRLAPLSRAAKILATS